MKTIIIFIFLLMFSAGYGQSIVIDSGAEINIQSGSDLCASNVGNISGNLTGVGSQCNGPLPVELRSISYSLVNNTQVKLSWGTLSEMNNKGFDILRSEKNNNTKWNTVGFVNGAGNSSAPLNYSFTDVRLSEGKYYYKIKQIDFNGNYRVYDMPGYAAIAYPLRFMLLQNYPNPFNPVTKITYQIPNDCRVTLKIYDVSGREVQTLVDNVYQKADYYPVTFNGSKLASGVYFYSLKADSYSKIYKMVLLK